ncbi:serine hydrolase domain-containing protein [Dermatobacter hominis]|uniref:serine hydrolase domain-containing protein n=1 Tax=Dermatobacter hominis TaxID=2884263 RepID=UPI001D110CC7|nr:serine hydrolase domain-containing protein [Dermatobacter hominis]UDY36791.1 beta-lactamase family protein [Dermatobacter hominis]
MSLLEAIDGWGATFAAAAVARAGVTVEAHGDTRRPVRVASITKLLTAWATLLAVEEGATALDAPAGPSGATVRHLLCHAGGYDFDTQAVLAPPGTRRIYSNTGYEVLADHVEAATGIPFADYLAEGVLQPLAMGSTELRGSPAADLWSDVDGLLRFAAETRAPALLHPTTVRDALAPCFEDLDGVLPGWGQQRPCWWGLGPELRGTKSPHWTGATAPPTTYGHFGGSGTFLWIDPEADLACVVLTDRGFGDWAVAAWPPFSDDVRAAWG